MLQLHRSPFPLSQICLENPPEYFEQDLKTSFRDGGIVAAFAQFIAYERVLRPGKLMKTVNYTRLAQLLANEIPSLIGDMRVLESEQERKLALEIRE